MKTLKTRHGVFTIDEMRDAWIYKNLTQRGGYQFQDIDLILPFITGNVIDAGAHIGLFTIPISKVAKQVWSIEGNKKTFDLLQKNLAANGCMNVHALNAVASSDSEQYHMVKKPSDGGTQFTRKKIECEPEWREGL